jgi:hypothetical protein
MSATFQAARVRVVPDLADQLCDLVNMFAIGGWPGTPLVTVDRPQISRLICPLIPYLYAMFFQVGNIGRAGQKPDQFMHDGFDVQFLGGQQRKTFLQVEAHLVAKYGAGAGTGTVGFFGAMLVDMTHEIEILTHGDVVPWSLEMWGEL